MQDIRPQLRFHDDDELRMHPCQEAAYRRRQIVGCVAVQNAVTERLSHALLAGGGGSGHDDANIPPAGAQRPHQRHRRLNLADGNRVNPHG